MPTLADSIFAYINAKDGNRPHLLDAAFTSDAVLQMVVKTEAISFPPSSVGRDAITEILVRRFNQTYENVYTLCIGSPPEPSDESFSCNWLVAMSEKHNGAVRVGAGRYDWSFERIEQKVRALTISIATMEILPANTLDPIMKWVSTLPYPWCSLQAATQTPPNIPGVFCVLDVLHKLDKGEEK